VDIENRDLFVLGAKVIQSGEPVKGSFGDIAQTAFRLFLKVDRVSELIRYLLLT